MSPPAVQIERFDPQTASEREFAILNEYGNTIRAEATESTSSITQGRPYGLTHCGWGLGAA